MAIEKTIDLTSAQHKEVLSLLKTYVPDTLVWAYGSRVKWTARPDSDLDLVVFSSSEQKANMSLLRETFEESNIPFRIDLFSWNEVPEQFRENIKLDYVVLQKSERSENSRSKTTFTEPSDIDEK